MVEREEEAVRDRGKKEQQQKYDTLKRKKVKDGGNVIRGIKKKRKIRKIFEKKINVIGYRQRFG